MKLCMSNVAFRFFCHITVLSDLAYNNVFSWRFHVVFADSSTDTAIFDFAGTTFCTIFRISATGGSRGWAVGAIAPPPVGWSYKIDFPQFLSCNGLSSPVMKGIKKCCLYPLSQYFLVLASEALKKGRKT